MTVLSGKFGVVNGQTTVRNWNLSNSMTPATFVASNTKFGTGRRAGVRDWTGSYAQYQGEPSVLAGESFAFQGYQGPDDGVSGAGHSYSGNAVVLSNTINWNMQGGALVDSVTNFGGDLALAGPTSGAEISDATFPAVEEVCATLIEHSTDGVAWTPLDDWTVASLTLTSAVQAYVNSSTGCNTGRKSGPLDWTASVTLQTDQEPLAIGSDHLFRFYTTATTFWLLHWGHVGDYSNITVNRESGEIISKVLNLGMNGYADAANPTDGIVSAPSGAVWWQAA